MLDRFFPFRARNCHHVGQVLQSLDGILIFVDKCLKLLNACANLSIVALSWVLFFMKQLPIFYICSIVRGNLNFLQLLSGQETLLQMLVML